LQQPAQQQSSRPRPDDSNLSSQLFGLRLSSNLAHVVDLKVDNRLHG
jgi:hypothetical protein